MREQESDIRAAARPAGGDAEEHGRTGAAEIDRQVRNLHDLGYPALAGMSTAGFDELLAPLLGRLRPMLENGGTSAAAHIPVLLVVSSTLVDTVQAVKRWSVRGKSGFTDMASELPDYRPISGVDLPGQPVYALVGVDTGRATLGVPPNDALPMILDSGRSPLTIDEGVALVTQLPDVFTSHNAFQAMGSRAQNKRVPSFWFSKGAPRLGWCWAGNPHSWLGAASAARRQGSG